MLKEILEREKIDEYDKMLPSEGLYLDSPLSVPSHKLPLAYIILFTKFEGKPDSVVILLLALVF